MSKIKTVSVKGKNVLNNLQQFLLELGKGFAFVPGRSGHFEDPQGKWHSGRCRILRAS